MRESRKKSRQTTQIWVVSDCSLRSNSFKIYPSPDPFPAALRTRIMSSDTTAFGLAAVEALGLCAIIYLPACRYFGYTRHFLPLGVSFLILQLTQAALLPFLQQSGSSCSSWNHCATIVLLSVFSAQPTLVAWLAARPPEPNGRGSLTKHQHSGVVRFLLWMGIINLGCNVLSLCVAQLRGGAHTCTSISSAGHIVWGQLEVQSLFPNCFFYMFCWGSSVAYSHDKVLRCLLFDAPPLTSKDSCTVQLHSTTADDRADRGLGLWSGLGLGIWVASALVRAGGVG